MHTSPITKTEPNWRRELASSYRSAEDLFHAGLISDAERTQLAPVLDRYQFLLPRYYAELIDRSDNQCPIRLQSIPSLRELEYREGYAQDPLLDLNHQPVQRVTHRYPNRLLIHLTPNCSMYCRFCFRKTLLNGLRDSLFDGDLGKAFDYVSSHNEVEEVIFSGGDPFLAPAHTLETAITEVAAVAHVKRIRLHTRVPVTFPMRVDNDLTSLFGRCQKPLIVVTHFNHPREVTELSRLACQKLHSAGITLFNQSVLLRGVNDSVECLALLSERLFEMRVIPYYLHHHDRPEGTAYFDVSCEKGIALHKELKSRLPGYLVPRYVVDVVGSPYKRDVSDHFWNSN